MTRQSEFPCRLYLLEDCLGFSSAADYACKHYYIWHIDQLWLSIHSPMNLFLPKFILACSRMESEEAHD